MSAVSSNPFFNGAGMPPFLGGFAGSWPGSSSMAGGNVPSASGPWPEWWTGHASAALGSNWLNIDKIKGSGRFKEKGLQHKDKLDIMFENLQNTDDDHWCASSGVAPSQGSSYDATNLDEEDEGGNEDSDDDLEELPTPTSGATRRVNVNDKAKKPKTAVRHWLKEQFGVLMHQSERTTALLNLLQGGLTLVVPSNLTLLIVMRMIWIMLSS
ncbi:hypothetical protein PR202_gb20937 [Eleusine coracana subsp. coracana]|uniref:Uncharacterized protein n=1 Tax=Eleusine coracana subsp. coracana TaxID=191504 RepID=A0AAV5F9W6_ELECO|nr:hypothetical protein PR202_gb20937 [Eleusine coracana subsp. coracana]